MTPDDRQANALSLSKHTKENQQEEQLIWLKAHQAYLEQTWLQSNIKKKHKNTFH